jgi:hypothetical protein
MSILLIVFYLTAATLAAVTISIAAKMSDITCICIKHSMVLLIMGLGFLVCSVYYSPPVWHRLLALIIIFWGLICWLFFDRYKAHDEFEMIKAWIFEHLYYLKLYCIDMCESIKDWRRKK